MDNNNINKAKAKGKAKGKAREAKGKASYAAVAAVPEDDAAAAAYADAPPRGARFSSLVVAVEGGDKGKKNDAGPSRATFDIRDVDLCIVNALRRAVMADVQTVAIAFDPTEPKSERDAGIQFLKNTGVLHNEFLGHRISMVPLGFEERQVAGYDPALYKFVLKKKNQGDEVIDVTTGDFVVQDVAGAVLKDLTALVFPPSPITGDHILLARLKPSANNDGNGEEISLEARARLGAGREHARWSPVSACFFRYKVDPEASDRSFKVKLDALGLTTADASAAAAAVVAALRSQHDALDGLREFYKNEHGEPAAFEFVIASESRLRPAFLVKQAFRALVDKVRRLSVGIRMSADADDAAADADADADDDADMTGGWGGGGGKDRRRRRRDDAGAVAADVRVDALANMEDFYEVAVLEEDHTLGNLVQGLLYRHWVREGGAKDVSFIGYHQPHPLEGEIVFKVKCARAGGDVRALLIDGLAWVVDELEGLSAEWDTFAAV